MTIDQAIAEKYRISGTDLYRKSKKRKITEPRMLAIALSVSTGIARQRDMVYKFDLKPSAVCTAIKTVRNMVRYNHEFRTRVVAVLKEVSDNKGYRESIIENLLSVKSK